MTFKGKMAAPCVPCVSANMWIFFCYVRYCVKSCLNIQQQNVKYKFINYAMYLFLLGIGPNSWCALYICTCTWVEGLYATNPRNYRRFQRHTPLTTGVTQCCKRNFEQFARKNVIRFREIVAKSECERLRNFSKFYVVR